MTSAIRKLVPLFDRVLVERIAPKQLVSKGGILLPETVASKINEGKVRAVGPGRVGPDGKHIKPIVAEGDTVLLPQNFSPHVLKINEVEMELIREEDIIAIIHQDK